MSGGIRRPVFRLPLPALSASRLSRPVLAYRRWRRWFRKTWVGREFGWILDEVTFLLVFLQVEVAQALSERRVRRFFSKKQNIAALVAAVLVVVAGYHYGKPHYRHYVETQVRAAGRAIHVARAISPEPTCACGR